MLGFMVMWRLTYRVASTTGPVVFHNSAIVRHQLESLIEELCVMEATSPSTCASPCSYVISGMATVMDVITGFIYCDHLQV